MPNNPSPYPGGSPLAEPGWLPSDSGLLAWNYDPVQAAANTVLTSGLIYLIRVNLRQPSLVTDVAYFVAAAGVTLTSGENFAGLYTSAGALIASSADLSALWAATAGPYQSALAGGPYQLPAGFYWVAIVSNGTTPIALGRQSNTSTPLSNFGTSPAASRFATNGSGTALPATITPSANTQIVNPFFAGLS